MIERTSYLTQKKARSRPEPLPTSQESKPTAPPKAEEPKEWAIQRKRRKDSQSRSKKKVAGQIDRSNKSKNDIKASSRYSSIIKITH